MSKDNVPRLVLFALAGTVAGLIVFAMLNPQMVAEETNDQHRRADVSELGDMISAAMLHSMLLGLTLAPLIGGMLTIANEMGSPIKRVAIKTSSAAAIGAAVGVGASAIAQMLFWALILMLPVIGVVIGRTLAWALIGVGSGVAVGYVLGGWPRARMGMIGGAIGGGVGGMMFDLLAFMTDGGSVSRLFGFLVIGMVTGAAIAYVEEVAKQNWVTILSGSREGRTYILTKSSTTVGRDELADIPLFGDPSIAKQHARLNLSHHRVMLQSTGGPCLVNGATAAGAELRDGDVVAIGRMSLRFNQKADKYAQFLARSPQFNAPVVRHPQFANTGPTALPSVPSSATGTITLSVISGPYAGQCYQSGPGLLKIGREADSSINLVQDLKISRNHAEISWDGANWSARDAGSTNGLWVNGERVMYRLLAIGDQIGIGQTVFRVDGV